jgi:hypothetical protein
MIFLDTPILSVAYLKKYKNDEAKPIEVIMLQHTLTLPNALKLILIRIRI